MHVRDGHISKWTQKAPPHCSIMRAERCWVQGVNQALLGAACLCAFSLAGAKVGRAVLLPLGLRLRCFGHGRQVRLGALLPRRNQTNVWSNVSVRERAVKMVSMSLLVQCGGKHKSEATSTVRIRTQKGGSGRIGCAIEQAATRAKDDAFAGVARLFCHSDIHGLQQSRPYWAEAKRTQAPGLQRGPASGIGWRMRRQPHRRVRAASAPTLAWA